MSEQYYFIMAIAANVEGDESSSSSMTAQNNQEGSRIQLSKIQIPNFNGDILCWITFRDIFKSLVHDNVNITNIERYHYLLSSVSGSAGAVIRSIPLSDSNYAVAWKSLNDRFDNQRLIMNAHLDRLFEFPLLKSSSLHELKKFLDTFQENIAALENFKIPNKEGYLFFYIAARVLDSNTKCLFESQHNNDTLPVINDLLKYVQNRCQILQNSFTASTPISSIKLKPAFSPSKKVQVLTKTSLVTNSSESNKACPLRSSSHHLYRCGQFLQLSPSKRLKKVQSNHMCTNCLSVKHNLLNVCLNLLVVIVPLDIIRYCI
jgi:hypothetical protein